MPPSELVRQLAAQAGLETGMCYPSAGNEWTQRFAELVWKAAAKRTAELARDIRDA